MSGAFHGRRGAVDQPVEPRQRLAGPLAQVVVPRLQRRQLRIRGGGVRDGFEPVDGVFEMAQGLSERIILHVESPA